MKQKIFIGIAVLSMILWGCEEKLGGIGGGSSSKNNKDNNNWLIPISEVRDGGPGKDGIPALSEPEFIPAVEADYLDDDDLILGFVGTGVAKAYPHRILDWHEIVNDQVGGVSLAVTYCPLTGTGIGWNLYIDGHTTTFGVSGLLYNSNLIPYDRRTDSNWSQIRLDCVNGQMIGTEIETFTLVETTWKTWNKMYPSSTVVSLNTGYNRDYDRYPYGSYRTNHEYMIFPVANQDIRIPGKARVHGIVTSGNAKVYPLSLFGEQVSVIEDSIEGNNYVVVGHGSDNFAVSFLSNPGDGTLLSFTPVQEQYPVVMTDDEGNLWDVFGTAVKGPRKGSRLKHARSFIGYWFSFAAFYPQVSIYEN